MTVILCFLEKIGNITSNCHLLSLPREWQMLFNDLLLYFLTLGCCLFVKKDGRTG